MVRYLKNMRARRKENARRDATIKMINSISHPSVRNEVMEMASQQRMI